MKMKGTGKCSGDGCEVMRVEGGDDDDVEGGTDICAYTVKLT
jgi:high-affinity K+ transport system ATPase subunit B